MTKSVITKPVAFRLAALSVLILSAIWSAAYASDARATETKFCYGSVVKPGGGCGTGKQWVQSAYAQSPTAAICLYLFGDESGSAAGCQKSSSEGVYVSRGDGYAHYVTPSIQNFAGTNATVYGILWDGPHAPESPPPPPPTKYRYMLGTSNGSLIGSWASVLNEMSLPAKLAVGDVNGDGKADIIAVESEGGGKYRYMLGKSNGTGISSWSSVLTGMSEATQMAVGDVNGDGKADIVSLESEGGGKYRYMLGLGSTSGISSWNTLLTGMSAATFLKLGDVTGDGKADIVAVESEGGEKYRYMLGTSKGTSVSWGFTSLTGMSGPWNVAVGDFTSDKKADIVSVEDAGGGSFRYMLGVSNGSGTFAWSQLMGGMGAPWGPTGMSLGDVNGDGSADIISDESEGSGQYRFMFGFSAGSAVWPWAYAITGLRLQQATAVGDFTGDGKADVISVEGY